MRILIVDDEPRVRTLARRMAEHVGYAVEEAEDGEQALQAIRSQRPDLVLCDVFMPGMEGLELVREMRRRFPAIPIVAMSGGGRISTLDALPVAMCLGAAATLSKPFSCQELLAAMATAAGLVSPVARVTKLPA